VLGVLTARDLERFSALLDYAAGSWELPGDGQVPDPPPRETLDRHAALAGQMAQAADVLTQATGPHRHGAGGRPAAIHARIQEAADHAARAATRFRRAAETAHAAPPGNAEGRSTWSWRMVLDHADGRHALRQAAESITAAQRLANAEDFAADLASTRPRSAPELTSEPPPPPTAPPGPRR
jgi:hypothetical protein